MKPEERWAGEFGNEYQARQQTGCPGDVQANRVMFGKILSGVHGVGTLLELGCGVGSNLEAIRDLDPRIEVCGVEVNQKACGLVLEKHISVIRASVAEWEPQYQWDLILCKGLLIHIDPSALFDVYEKISRAAKRYVLICEYFNPRPVEIPYRGQAGMLWKRDFAGEFMDYHPQFSLHSYGFVYDRDPFPQDNLTWFLMERT